MTFSYEVEGWKTTDEQIQTKIELKNPVEKSWLSNIRLYATDKFGSYHFDHKDYLNFNHDSEKNEENFIRGIGIPFEMKNISWVKEIEAFAFDCTNSEGHYSRARGINVVFGCTDTLVKVCGGLGFGGVDGYESNNGKFALSKYPFPHISLSYKQVRFNAYLSNVVLMYALGLDLGKF